MCSSISIFLLIHTKIPRRILTVVLLGYTTHNKYLCCCNLSVLRHCFSVFLIFLKNVILSQSETSLERLKCDKMNMKFAFVFFLLFSVCCRSMLNIVILTLNHKSNYVDWNYETFERDGHHLDLVKVHLRVLQYLQTIS